MGTPGTSGELKKLRVSTMKLQETSKQDEKRIVSVIDKDASHLLNIFPEEIWLEVLENVNRQSLESVNNASSFFRRLIYPDRQIFLFSPVWRILGVKYEVDSDPVYCDLDLEDVDLNDAREWGWGEQETPVFPVILKLRLVCREWCLAINKFYEDLYHNYDTEESVLQPRVESDLDSADEVAINRKYGRNNMGHWSEYELIEDEVVDHFLERFQTTHDSQTNPFPFRKVFFNSGDLSDEDFIDYCSKVIQLLKKYGHHIWFFELSFVQRVPSRLELYLKIQEILTLIPNVKVLRVLLSSFYNSRSLGEPGHPTRRDIKQIKEAMVTHPIPTLESLTFVSFISTPKVVMEHFLEKNAQLNKIDILCLENLHFGNILLPNLSSLAVCFEELREFQTFEKCGQLWRLEMLHVSFDLGPPTTFISHPRIFKCFEQWKDSLTDVVIQLPVAKRSKDKAAIVRNFGIRLDLPHVKRLRIEMYNIRSLDLILPMRNTLELLEYTENYRRDVDLETIPKKLLDDMERSEVIQFHSLPNNDMYNSNIWTLFPKLGRIHVKDEDFRNGPAYIRRKVRALEG